MNTIKPTSLEAEIEYRYLETHVINENNMHEYKDNFIDMLKDFSHIIKFEFKRAQLNDFLSLFGFSSAKDTLSFDDEQGCKIALTILVEDEVVQDLYVLQWVEFTKNDRYEHSYFTSYNLQGVAVSRTFKSANKILQGLTLKTIHYIIDRETLKIEQIGYCFNDNRKLQKGINGYVTMIVEHPLKRIVEHTQSFDHVNIYDVYYTVHGKSKEIRLIDILTQCDFSCAKMYGTDYTDFLTMSKMFTKRERDIIEMMYI
jgi:hypothetical protein